MYPVILSGGSGTQLWPLSRKFHPKQFLPIHSNNTLLQETLLRLKPLGLQAPIVLCNKDHRFVVAENMRTLGIEEHSIFLEPMSRNTAPAIAIAALAALKENENAILLIMPTDHVIENEESFAHSVKEAEKLVRKGHIVTFGITPTCAHTGYGYIQTGKKISSGKYKLAGFREKPDRETAESFIKKGAFLWNSGMFCFKARTYLEELEKHHPDIVKYTKASLNEAKADLDFIRLNEDPFNKCKNISIDYAVMEHTNLGAVITIDTKWNDIGSWDAIWEVCSKDKDQNVTKGDVITLNTKNSLIHSENKLVCTLGINNIIVIDTKDALLVANKDNAQEIKDIVSALEKTDRKETEHHCTVYRPWGHYDYIDAGERYQVKRISVKPSAKLSLQKHFHRSEHWIVVKGTAVVTRGAETLTLSENESIYLPIGTIHALANPSEAPLELIEIQTGEYLGEDDIERFEDLYGRAQTNHPEAEN